MIVASRKHKRLGALSRNSLTIGEARRLTKAMRAERLTPPKVGWCKKWRGGSVCHHPKSRYLKSDSGYQLINVNWSP